MSKPCTALLIDPFVLVIEDGQLVLTDGVPIQLRRFSGDYHEIYEQLRTPSRKPSTFEACYIDGDITGDVMYADEEGLLHGDATHWIFVEGFPNPVAGKGIVFGTDEEGDGTTPSATLASLWGRVRIAVGNVEVRLSDLPVGAPVSRESVRLHKDQVMKLWAQETGAW